MAHTKSGGSTKNGRDSIAKRLGVKRQNGQAVKAGEILLKQRGTRYMPGANVRRAGDDTLYAATEGTVVFLSRKKTKFNGNRRYIKVVEVVTKTS